jgi:hypothetical protein
VDSVDLNILKTKWESLCKKLGDEYGEEPDLQAILFLIGVQELGRGPMKFSKDEKQDLMHIAVCKLLSQFGYYRLLGQDQDGWPDLGTGTKTTSFNSKRAGSTPETSYR